MKTSKISDSADLAHKRRLAKVTPKARFKTLNKRDQYTVYARTLSSLLGAERKRNYRQSMLHHGYHITVSNLRPSLLIKGADGDLEARTVAKIKRAVSNCFKQHISKDAAFMFVIEEKDKQENGVEAHVHAIANMRAYPTVARLRKGLLRLTDGSKAKSVKIQRMTELKQRWNERAPSEKEYRKTALYIMKNTGSRTYRSKALMTHLNDTFEALKKSNESRRKKSSAPM